MSKLTEFQKEVEGHGTIFTFITENWVLEHECPATLLDDWEELNGLWVRFEMELERFENKMQAQLAEDPDW